MKLSKKRIAGFQKMIFDWWKTHRRDLPWRCTHDPYRILVSEIMLQQTQVARVLPKYQEFLASFPNVTTLAQASTADVLRAWRGMGYNRRALYLHKTAQTITQQFEGKFPENEIELRKLSGLGIYTARALLVFAYGKDVAMVDTNIRQIIVHYFFSGKSQKPFVIQEVADQLIPEGKSWEWHQALMDYGALEMPKYKVKKKRVVKRTIPFHESNRFFRGRIIDELREKVWDEHDLIKTISERYDKPEDFIQVIVETLAADGLVMRKDDVISLPS